jgi:hypothetical protein
MTGEVTARYRIKLRYIPHCNVHLLRVDGAWTKINQKYQPSSIYRNQTGKYYLGGHIYVYIYTHQIHPCRRDQTPL